MTAQIEDLVKYRGEELPLTGISEGELFDPADPGLEPEGLSTACYRGYMATFALSGPRLILSALDVNLFTEGGTQERAGGPLIAGVRPAGPVEDEDDFNNHYEGLNIHLPYGGGLLLGSDFIEDLYVHMGFQKPWRYKIVIELIIENGILRKESDHSEKMAEFRRWIVERSDPSGSDPTREPGWIREFIEQAFDRSYDS